MSYDRVLPRPPTLNHHEQHFARSTNLLEHKIMNDDVSSKVAVMAKVSMDRHHHLDHAPVGGAPRRYLSGLPQVHMINQSTIALNKLASPSLDAPKPSNLLAVKAIPLRERPTLSERSTSSSPVKSNAPTPRESATQFCLCQPDPKIPRPRNAFILYRQHYQAAVVAQNPGLANPDISKIIGEQWRKLPQETKDEWKALAEEEKARHQQQYPEYRYQPRRYGRDGNLRNGSSGISHNPPGSTVCSRCGGRVMNPPVSPETPFTPRSSTFNGAPAQNEAGTAQSNQGRGKGGVRPSLIKVNVDGESCLPRQREFEENGGRSPDNKRRRLGHRIGYGPHREGPESPYPPSPYTPRPSGLDLRFQPPIRSIRNVKEYTPPDPSLKLPPLQTTIHAPGATTPLTPFSTDSSIEATVMTIPFLNKIKVLAKISPPLTPAYHDGPSLRRGAVIAVDGQDPVLVKQMVDFLNTTLQKEGKYQTRVFGGPEVRSREGQGDSEQMGDATVDYLNIISSWHRISDEIVSFVKPLRASSEAKSVDEESTPGLSPRTITPKTADLHINSPEQSSDNGSVSTVSMGPGATVPVALVPRYQLTTADAFACSVPIGDSYAPLDHWQWMASLWRACVGPDITVYIRECEKEELERVGGTPVEIRLQDARTIVLRKTTSSPSELEEKSLKRVGFEIEDFLTQ
ncbi:putative HMG box protein [Aspergillus heteromorphus CBS 117.55]|uniref:Putative HMG box protein n=1 Tax=Aspergillus heteromorphus CBS 117.55 TaxID=1448321 RepID=A0A317WNT2_9EURO|nr:putative HMG box protein [Aspergillus heteromorphus CBS 117.55]PWY87645.1 putative HMG box protein [Aspergillus heteromorphus CBS 117.55]